MSDRWWRAYDRSRRDPKLQRLAAETFRGWYNLVCLASEYGGKLPSIADTAYELRKTAEATAKLLSTLEAAELFEQRDGVWSPRKWNTLQYKSDVSTDRVREFRERQRNVSETASESEADSEADSETEKKDHSAANGADKRGSRLRDDWQLTPDLRAFAGDLGLDPDLTRDEFVDYWTAIPGSRGLKLNWVKTFKNRCREIGKRPSAKGQKTIETFDQRRIREAKEAIAS